MIRFLLGALAPFTIRAVFNTPLAVLLMVLLSGVRLGIAIADAHYTGYWLGAPWRERIW